MPALDDACLRIFMRLPAACQLPPSSWLEFAALGADARVSEFELTMSATFKVVDSMGEIAMAPTKVTVVRQMENDPRNAVGKEGELRLLQSEMRDELADKILRRIGFYASNLGESTADAVDGN